MKYESIIVNLNYAILSVIDSTGFLPRGIIDGTFTSLGEYDQCISIQIPGELVKRNKETNPDVYGRCIEDDFIGYEIHSMNHSYSTINYFIKCVFICAIINFSSSMLLGHPVQTR